MNKSLLSQTKPELDQFTQRAMVSRNGQLLRQLTAASETARALGTDAGRDVAAAIDEATREFLLHRLTIS